MPKASRLEKQTPSESNLRCESPFIIRKRDRSHPIVARSFQLALDLGSCVYELLLIQASPSRRLIFRSAPWKKTPRIRSREGKLRISAAPAAKRKKPSSIEGYELELAYQEINDSTGRDTPGARTRGRS